MTAMTQTRPAARHTGTLAAVLGPTNTGKTHLAIERMLGHESGMIGLPLRLLAREVYNKVAERAGADAVALITGEEKIKPASPRYYVCTVEAMPRDVEVAFLAIDEVQLAADFDRGHVFTDRMLNARGTQETLLLGAATARPLIERLLPGTNILSRPRLSQLTYSGQTKLTRLPRRSAIVAFSADEVYAIAELVRRQRGGTAVVLGALSPRTRNAQVGLYQSGDVDYLVATDAIGMGLNLDIDHVAFAADRKFDGHQFRNLNPGEMGQIAGRAGRHLSSGTFGVTGRVDPFDAELVERLETHRFDPLTMLQWRNASLEFASLDALKASLAVTPRQAGLTRAPVADDERALDIVCREGDIRDLAADKAAVARLWEVCQVPDYRKIAPAHHADMIATIYRFLRKEGTIPDDWFARQLAYADRSDGDIDTLSNRLAHVRTWTFVANRADWLADPAHWQERTRDIEDRLSDALHERLAQRFVDRRTSVLMRRLRDNADLDLEIAGSEVKVEGQHVGHLTGFHFVPDASGSGANAKALRAAALKGLAAEYSRRAEQFAAAPDSDISLSDDGAVVWRKEEIARIAASDDLLVPRAVLISDEQLQGPDRVRIQERLDRWIAWAIEQALGPLVVLRAIETGQPLVRGLAFQLVENFGVLDRRRIAGEVRGLEQEARGILRRAGVRFGAHSVFVPALLKPASARVTRLLWALRNGGLDEAHLARLPQLATQGLMSVSADPQVPKDYYEAVGYRLCGNRVVRVDMLERLADVIRPLVSYRTPKAVTPKPEAAEPDAQAAQPAETPAPTAETPRAEPAPEQAAPLSDTPPPQAPATPAKPKPAAPPAGALGDGRFMVTPEMMSLVGCSGEDFAAILKSLGFRSQPLPAPPQAEKRDAEKPDGGQAARDKDAEAPAPPLAWRPAGPRHAGPRRGKQAQGKQAPNKQAPGKQAHDNTQPAGKARPPRRAKPGKQAKPHPPNGRQGGKPGKPGGRPKPREREADPLSPFAALADLKRSLQAGGGKGKS